MRPLKKIICTVFALIIFFSCLPVTRVLAADPDMRYGRKVLGQMANGAALQYAYDRLDQGLQSGMPEVIDLSHSTYRVSTTEFMEYVFPLFYSDCPEYFWLKNGGYNYKYQLDNTITSIAPAYLPGFSNLAAAKAALNAKVNELISGLSGTDYAKSKALHDRICSAVDYVSTPNDQSAYGALVEGKAVCAGYARAYQYLLQKVGIPAWYVRGSSINPNTNQTETHGWNMVKLDGQWYYSDVTWDDQRENIFYAYWNITTQQLLKTHTIDSLYTGLIPTATATAANYYSKENLVFSAYDQNRLADLLNKNNRKVQIYVDTDPYAFIESLDNNLLSLGKQLGGTGAFQISYSVDILGNALIMDINLQSEGHQHAPATAVPAVAATCLTSGQSAYYICSCGAKFLDQACANEVTNNSQLTTPAKEHTPVWKQDIANHWKACSVCDSESAGTRSAHTDGNNDLICDVCNNSMPTAQHSDESTNTQKPDNNHTEPTESSATAQPTEDIGTETRRPDNDTPTQPESNPADTTNPTVERDSDSTTSKNKTFKISIILYILGSTAVVGIIAAAVILSSKKKP